jgi:hypothetical protein
MFIHGHRRFNFGVDGGRVSAYLNCDKVTGDKSHLVEGGVVEVAIVKMRILPLAEMGGRKTWVWSSQRVHATAG